MQPTLTSEREVGCCHHTVHFAHAPDWYAVGNEFKKRASRGCKKIISFVLYAQKRLIFSRRVTTCFAVGSLCILRTRERGAEDGGASLSAFRRGWRWLSARLGCGGSCWDIFSDPVLGNSHAPLREGALGIKQGGERKAHTQQRLRVVFFSTEDTAATRKERASLAASGSAPVVGVHACVLHRMGGKNAQDPQGASFRSVKRRRRRRIAGRVLRGLWTTAGWWVLK